MKTIYECQKCKVWSEEKLETVEIIKRKSTEGEESETFRELYLICDDCLKKATEKREEIEERKPFIVDDELIESANKVKESINRNEKRYNGYTMEEIA